MQSKHNAINQPPGNHEAHPSSGTDPKETLAGLIYEIQVKGCKDQVFWSDWFGDMAPTIDLDQGVTTLRCPVTNQAELYGLLNRLRNKGLSLISVHQVSI